MALLFALMLFWQVRENLVKVEISAEGITLKIPVSSVISIPWGELAECGLAIERWREDPIRCLYFSDHTLKESQRVSMGSTEFLRESGLIAVSCVGLQNMEKLAELCPLPIPSMQFTDVSKYELTSYYRERELDGSWGEAKMKLILHADKVAEKSWRKQLAAHKKK